ncbi:hypothetical protein BDV98DRAFT_219464 [Pterulicium gracile]|uniref:F-box domain-containing protein n=1 Tax=Pterulicium gracile TaxID=1884261 RepID=A0A5C3QAL8_9AGAR|nr:hypothetical protein BDV98DRAFT_219464 [Pterula gracilis]
MPSSSINHRIRARSSIKSPCYGYGCGLKDAKACCTLLSPFQLQQFDFSPHAYRTAKRVLKEGESNKSRIEDAIQRLRARRNQIRGVMKQNRALLAPIHRLPDEVLILIFEEASWKFCADIAFSPSFQRMAAPWVISRVCRRWRRVTLSGTCSHFWVNIDVQLYKANHHIPLDWYMWFVELQSARAGSMPLHISVDFRIKPQPHKPDVRRMVLSFISKNSLRCYSMRINQPPYAIFNDSPQLDALQVLDVRNIRSIANQERIFGTTSAPQLHTVTMVLANPTAIPIDWWENFTYFHLTSCSHSRRNSHCPSPRT